MANKLNPDRTVSRDRGRAKQRAAQQLIERHRDEHAELLHAADEHGHEAAS